MRLLLSLLLFLLAQISIYGQETPPNIVLVVADDLGWRDVGFNGGTLYDTPNLDRLAGEAMVFRQAYASASNCAPSRAAMISGRYAPYTGIYTVAGSDRGKAEYRKLIPTQNVTELEDKVVTLAEQLQSAGYATVSIGKWHLGFDSRTQGFDRNVAGTRAGHPKGYFSPYQMPFLADGPDGEYLTDRLTSEAIQFVHENANNPFFLYLPYYTVHTPIQGKPEVTAKYKGRPGIKDYRQAQYGAMVETLDKNVGRISATLKELGLDENTLFVFTSDNGGIAALTPQDPLRAGKGSYYEGGIRVPAFFRWPGEVPAGISELPITNLDFYPTLLEVAGIRSDIRLDGVDLLPHVLENASVAERPLIWHFPIYLEAYSPGLDGSRDPLFRTRPGSVIRIGEWKLHQYFEDGGLELYNLTSDLGERENLAKSRPEVAARLLKELEAWRKANNAPVPRDRNPEYDAAVEKAAIDGVR